MRELKIFKERELLVSDNGSIVLHKDDMKAYPSWMLTNDKQVDKVIYRGSKSNFDSTSIGLDKTLFENKLKGLGNPELIMITFDKDSKNLL